MNDILEKMIKPDRSKVTAGMTESEKKTAEFVMDCFDRKAQELNAIWGRSIRDLL